MQGISIKNIMWMMVLFNGLCTYDGYAVYQAPSTLKEAMEKRQAEKDLTLTTIKKPEELKHKKHGDIFYYPIKSLRVGLSVFPKEAFNRWYAIQKTMEKKATPQDRFNDGYAVRNTTEPLRVIMGPDHKYLVYVDDYYELFLDHEKGAKTIPVIIVRDDSDLHDEELFWNTLEKEGLVYFGKPRPKSPFVYESPKNPKNAAHASSSKDKKSDKKTPDHKARDQKTQENTSSLSVMEVAKATPHIEDIQDDFFLSTLEKYMPRIAVYRKEPFIRVYGYSPYVVGVRLDPKIPFAEKAMASGVQTVTTKHQSIPLKMTKKPQKSGVYDVKKESFFSRILNAFSKKDTLTPLDVWLQRVAPFIQKRIENDVKVREDPQNYNPILQNLPDLTPLLRSPHATLDEKGAKRLCEIFQEAKSAGDFEKIPNFAKRFIMLPKMALFDTIRFQKLSGATQKVYTEKKY